MMHQADLPHKLWAEAIRYAAWLKNRLPTKDLGSVTPYKRLYGNKPHLAGLPEWGQWVWVHDSSGSKLDTRATQAHWVGYDAESRTLTLFQLSMISSSSTPSKTSTYSQIQSKKLQFRHSKHLKNLHHCKHHVQRCNQHHSHLNRAGHNMYQNHPNLCNRLHKVNS